MGESRGSLPRLVIGRGVGDRLGIEQHQIGGETLAHETPVDQPQSTRCTSAEVTDALFQRHQTEVAAVVPEVAREGAPSAGMRFRTDQQTVAAAGMPGISHDGLYVLLVA